MSFTSLRKFILSAGLLLCGAAAFGQGVTTSSMSGVVTSQANEPLPGATVKAVHEPSGTVYGVLANEAGRFTLPNMRVGGPYTVTVEYVGFKTFTQEGVYLQLGQTYIITPKLADESVQLTEVTISGQGDAIINSDRTGATTNIGTQQIMELPAINRSISDFTRLTPQSNGTSLAGRNGLYNNITIDGALVNNVFGLSSNPLPGASAGTEPISLDAIEEIAVQIAPYDVRQSGFTGGGISAVTRSGTNEFSGSAYWFAQRGRWQGDRNFGQDIPLPQTTTNLYGARLGGPIIKDKLFFFVNAERSETEEPFSRFRPRNAGEAADGVSVSSVLVDSLNLVRDAVRQTYGLDFGPYTYDSKSENTKLFARIDFNLNQNNRFSLRYSYTDANGPLRGASSSDDTRIPRGGTRSDGPNSIPFFSQTYNFTSTIQSLSFEWNTLINNRFSNQLLITGTTIDEKQLPNSPVFPTVDIINVEQSISTVTDVTSPNFGAVTAATLATSLGPDPFRGENEIKQDQFLIQNNFSAFLGAHTLTAGASFEYYDINNRFLRARWGRYIYRSFDSYLAALEANRTNSPITAAEAPVNYWLGYDLPGRSSDALLEAAQLGVYVQDEWIARPNLRITAGIRADFPFYLSDILANPEASNQFGVRVGEFPDQQVLLAPRIGVNWDVFGDRVLQVRGGSGIFNGRIPFVWMTNNVGLSGGLSGSVIYAGTAATGGGAQLPSGEYIRFSPAVPQPYIPANGSAAGTLPLNFVSDDFKWTQVWRTSLGADYNVGEGWILTFDGAFTKDINGVLHTDRNLVEPNGFRYLGPSGASFQEAIIGTARRVTADPYSREVVGLENTSKGYTYFVTGQISHQSENGLYLMAAYTYTGGEAVSDNPGSSANSVFQVNPIVGNPNTPQLGPIEFAAEHRIVAAVNKTFNYSKYASTTIGAFYQIQTGPRYSYTYSGDVNGDLATNNDLMYIPRDASEIIFVQPASGGDSRTPAQMSAQFFAFLNQDPYLSANKGQFAERNGATLPMVGRLDLRILQNFHIDVNGKKNTLQFSLEIFNFGNLLNDQWGVFRRTSTRQPLQLVDFNGTGVSESGVALTGLPRFFFPLQDRSNLVPQTTTFLPDLNSRYSIQAGIRYIFN